MIYARDLFYNGASLSSIDPDLVIVSFSPSNLRQDAPIIARTVNKSQITYDEPFTHDYGVVDNDVFKFEITIMNQYGELLTQDLVRRIIRWLFSPTVPLMASFDRSDCIDVEQMYDDLYYMGRFTSATFDEQYGAYKIGINLTFECTSPYAFTQEYTYSFATSGGSTTIEIENLGSYVGKIIAPTISIFPSSAGQYSIQNLSDPSQGAFIINVGDTSSIRISNFNTHYYDSTNNEWKLLGFDGHLENFYWPVIVDGVNTFEIKGNCTGSISTRFYETLGV